MASAAELWRVLQRDCSSDLIDSIESARGWPQAFDEGTLRGLVNQGKLDAAIRSYWRNLEEFYCVIIGSKIVSHLNEMDRTRQHPSPSQPLSPPDGARSPSRQAVVYSSTRPRKRTSGGTLKLAVRRQRTSRAQSWPETPSAMLSCDDPPGASSKAGPFAHHKNSPRHPINAHITSANVRFVYLMCDEGFIYNIYNTFTNHGPGDMLVVWVEESAEVSGFASTAWERARNHGIDPAVFPRPPELPWILELSIEHESRNDYTVTV